MVGDLDEDIDGVLSASGSFFVFETGADWCCSARRLDIFDFAGLVVVFQRTRLDGCCTRRFGDESKNKINI